ncbi:MAG: 2-dehydropantoate 2-reductase [Betaproteobacteria bacterium]|nr:2-dehydropantoate 2-reductase [Betaproteobacteria bacterium]
MGAGAVGCYFGGMLARAGHMVTLIGRAQHVEAVNREGLWLESLKFAEFIPLRASTDVQAVRDADLVLFCVKTPDSAAAARELALHLKPDAALLSLQNGVDNVARIRPHVAVLVIPSVVYVAATMTGPGRMKHGGRGELIIGLEDATIGAAHQPTLAAIAAICARAAIPCRVAENIEGDMWEKLLMNCAYNAISALGRAHYGRIAKNAPAMATAIAAAKEVLAVAKASKVRMPDRDLIDAAIKLALMMTTAISSTAQDIARGKRTEIDFLNGFIVERGKTLNVATPVNQALHALVKLLEESLDD